MSPILQQQDGWSWQCEDCGATAEGGVQDREQARELFKQHRASCPKSTSSQESPVMNTTDDTATATETAPAAPAKKAKKPAKKVAKKAATAAKKDGKVWRFGIMQSPKGRDVFPRVGKNGKLSTRAAKRLKAKQAPKWGRIRAANRGAAIKALKAGKGEWFTPSKGEE